jgi:hypothetical protein
MNTGKPREKLNTIVRAIPLAETGRPRALGCDVSPKGRHHRQAEGFRSIQVAYRDGNVVDKPHKHSCSVYGPGSDFVTGTPKSSANGSSGSDRSESGTSGTGM